MVEQVPESFSEGMSEDFYEIEFPHTPEEMRTLQKEQKKAKKIARKLLRRKKWGRTAMPINRNTIGELPGDSHLYREVDKHLARHNIKAEVYELPDYSVADPIPDQHIISIKKDRDQEVPMHPYLQRRIRNNAGGGYRVHPPGPGSEPIGSGNK